MANLEIGYIAGSRPELDRRFDSVRAVVQKTVRPHELISVPGSFVRYDLPIILDVSVASKAVSEAIEAIRSKHIVRPWLVIRMSGWFGVPAFVLEEMDVCVYRNSINVRPIVLRFLARYPREIREPISRHAISDNPKL